METLCTIVFVMVLIIMLMNSSKKEEMWEILVPASNKIQEFTYEHHKAWDEFVIGISGGITIMKTVKGEWVSPNNVRFKDRMIPVRIKCSGDDIDKIIDFTIKHYEQEAVLAYKISEEVILRNKSELEDE
jgi:hypothetical protein